MSKPPAQDEVSKPKAKMKHRPKGPATKAEHAAMKRIDKMVIKRMRKR